MNYHAPKGTWFWQHGLINIIMLVPELEKVKHKIVERLIHPRQIAKVINDAIFDIYGVEVQASSSEKVAIYDLAVNAYFDHENWKDFNSIEIHIVYSSKLRKGIKIDEEGWRFFQFRLYQALCHEMIHLEQAKKRLGLDAWFSHRQKGNWYFHDPDEIEAHAHDIALELLFYGYSTNKAVEKLKNYKQISISESVTLFSYMTYFKFDIFEPCIKKLIKKTIKFLERRRDTSSYPFFSTT